ncbi:hypothetical protein GLW08_00565 [Pontibacillus yanchengensis]|uniref:Uncharacterized protein n=1 Tax=Pontibacillus yanchengensis TaxID=462910 RepID=A0ACC7VAG0_9BACI|nr:hypothetical protein [Pontibacillus yanchengensis]MYL51821.1 hypothetical protein [Pontibacillus yanchengensis]
MTNVLINTVLLEKNRWREARNPSLEVSEWLSRFHVDGFTGIELWENHVLKASNQEIRRLEQSKLPVQVYNSYVRFDDGYETERLQAAKMIQRLQPQSVKFNLGNNTKEIDTYLKNLEYWASQLPSECQLLCECHPGTIMEDPRMAKDIFTELNNSKYKAIIHPFHKNTDLQAWFDYVGARISHAHVSVFDNGTFFTLEERSPFVRNRFDQLKRNGFKGSYSIEFTSGVATERESIELVYQHAVQDKDFLIKLHNVGQRS